MRNPYISRLEPQMQVDVTYERQRIKVYMAEIARYPNRPNRHLVDTIQDSVWRIESTGEQVGINLYGLGIQHTSELSQY